MAKAISIQQPWAWLIVSGIKPVENRTWLTTYRGPLFIHAGKRVPPNEELREIELAYKVKINRADLTYGGIIGCAKLVDCVEEHDSPFFCGPFGFVLDNARPVPFVPMLGKLGLFYVPEDLDQRPAVDVPVVLEPQLL